MRALCWLLIPLLWFQDAGAQTSTANSFPSPERYSILTAGFGIFYPSRAGHDFSTSFPYTLKDVNTGVETNQTFNGALHGRFTSPISMIDLLGLELVRKHHSIDLGFGLSEEGGGNHGFYVKGGYGYILSFGGLQLKPTLDFCYLFGGNNTLGKIDNKQKEVFLPGVQAGDQFDVYTSDEYSSTDETYDADHMDVNYVRSVFYGEPKLVLAPKPRGRFAFSLEFGWMVQLMQISRLQYEQYDDGESHSKVVGHTPLVHNGNLSGPYAAIHVGVYLWPKGAH
jgi:hypothetical protein